jgi:hypothetical protein
VLVEKPISVHKATATAHRGTQEPEQVFGAIVQPAHRRLLSEDSPSGAKRRLGEIRRINWIITNWFRSEAYYARAAGRATGPVKAAACAEPVRTTSTFISGCSECLAGARMVRAGRYHNIEVEDDVTAYLEYPDGKTRFSSPPRAKRRHQPARNHR